jgi:3-oxoacyl-[acyl-carrier-protein] synthase I
LAAGLNKPATPAALRITAQSLVSAAGVGVGTLAACLREQRTALAPNNWSRVPLATWIGRVADIDPGSPASQLPKSLAAWDCRSTRLAYLGLLADDFLPSAHAAITRHGAARVGLVLGTSGSTIGASEEAYQHPAPDGGFPAHLRLERLHTLHALADFVQTALGLQGPCATVSTACSSSAKAFAQAARWLQLGLADAVVVGGVDALSESILFGFQSLQLVSPAACAPFGQQRHGISVGEAAGYALLERGPGPLQLLGWGESNDAHHMSSPHPQGLGAELALDRALHQASLTIEQIDYLNLHGTASARNDEVEAALVARRYAQHTHASATKGVTGHTMGAAGIVEALVCLQALQTGQRSGSVGTGAIDSALAPGFEQRLQLLPAQADVQVAASHSFGFGGNNCVLLFGQGS